MKSNGKQHNTRKQKKVEKFDSTLDMNERLHSNALNLPDLAGTRVFPIRVLTRTENTPGNLTSEKQKCGYRNDIRFRSFSTLEFRLSKVIIIRVMHRGFLFD